MRAVICHEPGKLELIDVPRPETPPGMVAVDVKAIGICGTDFHIFEGTHPFLQYPRVMGHELSGIVAEAPAGAGLRTGTPVVVNPYLHCGKCAACRKGRFNCCAVLRVLGVHMDGGMCERIVVPAANLYPAGDMSLRDAAMVEFLAIGAHAVARAGVREGDRVLIVGAGPIGAGTALFARAAGGNVTLSDVSAARLATMAQDFGFGDGILAGPDALAAMKERTNGELFDVVFDATGNARAMEGSYAFVASAGTLVMVGVLKASLTFDDAEFHRKEMNVLATRNALKQDFDTVMAAMRAGKIATDALNTHSDVLDALPVAMPGWLHSKAPPIKAIVTV